MKRDSFFLGDVLQKVTTPFQVVIAPGADHSDQPSEKLRFLESRESSGEHPMPGVRRPALLRLRR